MKKRWLIVLGLVAALILVGGGSLWWYRTHHKSTKANVAAQSKTYQLYSDDTLTSYRDAAKDVLTSSGAEATMTTDSSEADVVITSRQTDGSTVLHETETGTPDKLADATFVSPTAQPDVFLSTKLSGDLRDKLIDKLKQVDATAAPDWTLSTVGDIIIGRTVYAQLNRYNDYTKEFAEVAPTIQASDMTLGDLESTIADGIPHPTGEGVLNFSAPTQAVDGLTFAGIDAVNLANNHSYNGGAAAFESMMATLKAHNIGYFGAGYNATEAHTPLIKDVKGIKVALLGYTSIVGSVPATATTSGQAYISMKPWGSLDESQLQGMEADIRAAKAQADLVFVYYHWGVEYTHDANDDQRTVAHRAVDAGADLILGTHPHWVQGIEWYKNKLITYNAGNFVFDQEWSLLTKQGVILQAKFSGKTLTDAKFVPIQIEDYYQPRLLDAVAGQQILNNIYTHSWWPVQ